MPKISLKDKLAASKKAKSQDTAPHVIVQALAGTGKTTTLIEALKLLAGTPSKLTPSTQQQAVWDAVCQSTPHARSVGFVAFNKSIAEELQRRVPAGVDAMTMHSMGLKAVTNIYGRVKVVGHRVDDLVAGLLPQYADIWDLRRKRPGLLPLVRKLVDLCKMNLLDGTEEDCYGLLAHHAMDPGEDATIVPEAVGLVPQILELCADPTKDGAIDFCDMIWLPVKNKLVVKRYDLLMVDECQDLNRCQQELAKKAGHRLVLVGDSHQAIYGFAGADAESMKRMENELADCPTCIGIGKIRLSKDGEYGGGLKYSDKLVKCPACRGCVVFPLTVTRRCGKAIVEEARKYVPAFEAHESNGPGKVTRATLEAPFGLLNIPCYRILAEDGDMVLCRMNAPLVSECFKFLKAGHKASIQGRDIGQGLVSTVKGTKAESITDLIHALSRWVSEQTAKEQAKKHPSEDKLTAIEDRYDCIMAFVEGQSSVAGVFARIKSVFGSKKCCKCNEQYDDSEDICPKCKGPLVDAGGIKLSSIHKAKGLESKRVFILETEKTRKVLEISQSKGGWQYEQELNLRYVAVTRAIEELCYVS